jgi:hypothetical protein
MYVVWEELSSQSVCNEETLRHQVKPVNMLMLGVVDGGRLATLPATQVAWVRIPVPSRPTLRVEKVALFCIPASGGMFSSTAIEIIKWVKKFVVAQAKVSHILRPGSA